MKQRILFVIVGVIFIAVISWHYYGVERQPALPPSAGIVANSLEDNEPHSGNRIGGPPTPVVPVVAPPRLPTPVPPHLSLASPIVGTLPGDPLQSQSLTANGFNGKLVYSFNDKNQSYLVLHILRAKPVANSPGSLIMGQDSALTYPIVELHGHGQLGGLNFDPQFSPDGNFVLVKVGNPEAPHSSYHLYVWDLKTNHLQSLTGRALFFRRTCWSPDSNYVAYVAGGDVDGATSLLGQPLEPLQLISCDWRTGQEHSIAYGLDPFSVAWAKPHTLFYSVRSRHQVARATAPLALLRFDIYAAPGSGGHSNLVIKNGQHPVPSPDAQRIACFGPSQPGQHLEESDEEPYFYPFGGSVLTVLNRGGTARHIVSREPWNYLAWEADNRHLLTLIILQPPQGSNTTQAKIKEWDVRTRCQRLVAVLKARDFQPISRDSLEPQFHLLGLSKDGKSLTVVVEEVIGYVGQDRQQYNVLELMQSIRLKDGTMKTLARLNDWSQLDWHEDAGQKIWRVTYGH